MVNEIHLDYLSCLQDVEEPSEMHHIELMFIFLDFNKPKLGILLKNQSYGDGKTKDCILGFVSISSNSLLSMIFGSEFLAELMHSTFFTLTIQGYEFQANDKCL